MPDAEHRVVHQYETELLSLDLIPPEITVPSHINSEGNAVAEASYALQSFQLTDSPDRLATASTVPAIKAPSEDLCLSDSSSTQARITEGKDAVSRSLMDLPVEIRRIILTKLLWYRHPLEFNPNTKSLFGWPETNPLYRSHRLLVETSPPANGQLHPQILQTCKRLYSEGSSILYSNTINCRVGQPAPEPDETFEDVLILRPEYTGDMARVPSAIRKKMSRVRVQLFAHHQRSKRKASRDEMGTGFAELALAFKEAPAWKTITIEVIHIYHRDKLARKSRDPADSIKFACTFWPLRYVCRRSAVTINGLSSRLISDLPTLMTSTDQVVDLLLAYDAMKEYMQTVMGDQFRGRNQGPQYRGIGSQNLLCGRAVRHGDVDGFSRARSRIMAILTRVVLDRESNVYRHDPFDWDSGPRLYVSRPDGESLASLQNEDVVEDEDRPLSEFDADEVLDEDTDAYDDSEFSGDIEELSEDEEDEGDLDSIGDVYDSDDH